jgi:hypothetical protein
MDFLDNPPSDEPVSKVSVGSKLTIKHLKFESEAAFFEIDELVIENITDLRSLISDLNKEFS